MLQMYLAFITVACGLAGASAAQCSPLGVGCCHGTTNQPGSKKSFDGGGKTVEECQALCGDCKIFTFSYGWCTVWTSDWTESNCLPLATGAGDCGHDYSGSTTYTCSGDPPSPVPPSPSVPYYPPLMNYCATGTDIPELDGCQTLEDAQKRCSWSDKNCQAFWYSDDQCNSQANQWVYQGNGCCWNPEDSDRPYPLSDGPIQSGDAGRQECQDKCNPDSGCGMYLFFPGDENNQGYCTTYPFKQGKCPHDLKVGPGTCGSNGDTAETYYWGSSPSYNVQFRSNYMPVPLPPGSSTDKCYDHSLNGRLGSPQVGPVTLHVQMFSPNTDHVMEDSQETSHTLTAVLAGHTCRSMNGCKGFTKYDDASALHQKDTQSTVYFDTTSTDNDPNPPTPGQPSTIAWVLVKPPSSFTKETQIVV